ncbi:MAG TPA: ubiquinone/menaquinone biosynthesis methyltransferase [Fibrobacteria bacterium]|nr:ubiquinone/menaquinone biosynthesis methyltransferase [Fibrobacteria bacterium]
MGIAIQNMFDGIAGRYDFLNRFLSAGRDRVWRRKAAERLMGRGARNLLDLCGGTGDFWHSWIEAEARTGNAAEIEQAAASRSFGVIADFSLPMLLEARRKFVASAPAGRPRPALVRMDALHPCFKEGRFDAVICAYGMRNLDSLGLGLDQITSVLKPGGVFVTLEFFRPTTLFTRFFYGVMAPLAIPFLGWLFSSRRQAYAYLVDSIRRFCSVWEYRERSRQQGFRDVEVIPCDFGISHIVTAVKA